MFDPQSSSRRRSVRQILAWSALSAAPQLLQSQNGAKLDHGLAHDHEVAQALILGDWGWLDVIGPDDLRGSAGFAAQTQVAQGMWRCTQMHALRPDALFLLGDSWYGDLADGARSARWQTQFEQM